MCAAPKSSVAGGRRRSSMDIARAHAALLKLRWHNLFMSLPVFNLVYNSFFNSFRRPPSLGAIRKTSATMLLVVTVLLPVIFALPATLHPSDELEARWRTVYELVNGTATGGMTFEVLISDTILYHAVTEFLLLSAAIIFAFISFFAGIAEFELHDNMLMHGVWWRIMRGIYLIAFLMMCAGIFTSKLMLTRVAILVWPWPDEQLAYSTLASSGLYVWLGRSLSVLFPIGLAWAGHANLEMHNSVRSTSTHGLKKKQESAIGSHDVVISRADVLAEFCRYVRSVEGGVERVDASGFESYLLFAAMRRSRTREIGVGRQTHQQPKLTSLTRKRAMQVYEDFTQDLLEREREKISSLQRMLIQDLLHGSFVAGAPTRQNSSSVKSSVSVLSAECLAA